MTTTPTRASQTGCNAHTHATRHTHRRQPSKRTASRHCQPFPLPRAPHTIPPYRAAMTSLTLVGVGWGDDAVPCSHQKTTHARHRLTHARTHIHPTACRHTIHDTQLPHATGGHGEEGVERMHGRMSGRVHRWGSTYTQKHEQQVSLNKQSATVTCGGGGGESE